MTWEAAASYAVIGALCVALSVVLAAWLDHLCGDDDEQEGDRQ